MKKAAAAVLIAIFVYLISSFAFLYGLKTAPPGMFFLGGHLPNSGEILNMVLPQIREGYLLIKNLYTSEPQPRIFFAPSYFPLAAFGLISPWNELLFIHLGRFFYTVIFFLVSYRLFKLFKTPNILLSLLTLGLSSGLGFFLNFAVPDSADLWIAELNTFHSILLSPNVIFTQILMMISLWFFYSDIKFSSVYKKVVCSLTLTLLSFEHQFSAMVIIAAIFLFIIHRQRTTGDMIKQIFKLWYVFLPPLLIFLFYFSVSRNNQALSWMMQNNLSSPPLVSYLSGFGLVGLGAFIAVLRKKTFLRNDFRYLMFFWLLAVILFIYSPLPFQRRFSEGVHIPLVMFFSLFFAEILKKFKETAFKKILVLFFLIILSATNFYLLYLDMKTYKNNRDYYYFYRDDFEALEWLRVHSGENDIILADAIYSPLIPGLIGRTVYFGHRVGTILTMDFQKKEEAVKSFFFYAADEDRKKFLKNNGITFFFLGKRNVDTEDYTWWDTKPFLRKVREDGGAKIYKIIF